MTAAGALTLTLAAADPSAAADAVMADWLIRSYLPAVLDHTPFGHAIEDPDASYRAMWTRVYGVAGTLELEVAAGAA